MKGNAIKDERIIAERRKIQSTGYSILVYALLISILVQQFFLRAPIEQYLAELIILIASGIYNAYGHYKKGIGFWNPSDHGMMETFKIALLSGIALVISYGVVADDYEISSLIMYFVVYVVFTFVSRVIMIRIEYKKRESIDKELNDDSLI